MTHVFRHPKFYRIPRDKSNQAISYDDSTESQGVRPGPGLKQQAASDSQVVNQVKLSSQSQAASTSKQQAIEETVPHIDIQEAASDERQATSEGKLQATSSKRQAPRF